VETIERKLATRKQLMRPSMVVATASNDASAPRTSLAVAVYAGAPPPSNESVREALTRWINDGGWLGGGVMPENSKISNVTKIHF
jgi:hypothetical protein